MADRDRNRDTDRERRGRRSEWEEDWNQRSRSDWDYDRPEAENRTGYDRVFGRDYGRGYNRRWDDEERLSRDERQDWGSRNQGRFSGQPDRGGRGWYTGREDFGQRPGYRGSTRDWDIEDEWEEDYGPTIWTYEEWWIVPGPYSGVGPRGFQRSDERIFEDACERLSQHGQIDASDIDLEVKDGEVWLRGNVDNRRTKRLAEDMIEDISGVTDVHNELRVRQERTLGRGREEGYTRQEAQRTTHRQQEGQMRGMSGENVVTPGRVREGMEVIGTDGEHIGNVKEVRSNDLLVDRPMARDVYIPIIAVRRTNGQIVLNIKADEVDDQNWPAPELFGTESGGQEGMTS